MKNNGNENYSHKDRNSHADNSRKYESQSNKENHESKNAVDIKSPGVSQRSPENGRDSNTPGSDSGSFNAINRNNENPEDDSKDNLMPNPDDFDEGDDEDSEGKGIRLRAYKDKSN